MTIVQHTVTYPDGGDPAVGVTVNVRLVVAGYVTNSKVGILGSSYATTDATGKYQVDLAAQSTISPAGTYYIIEHELRPAKETYTIAVPDGAGPFDLVDCLVTDLIPPGVTAVTPDSLTQRLSSYARLLPPAGTFTYDGSGNLTGSTDGLVLTYDGQGRVSTISDGTTTRTLNYSGTSTSPASVS